jgi:type IV pilus assembly protein PilV
MPVKSSHRRRGFSLLEALLSLLVLSIGLLGAAALLLQSLRAHGGALQRLSATQLVRDMADRIRANPEGRAFYDTRWAPASLGCTEPAGCDIAERAATDLAHFFGAARVLFPHDESLASVEYEPALASGAPVRYVITLSWRDVRTPADDTDRVALLVLAQMPVAS